ncbi:hypothetical protein [Streptomyces sp. B93]|uniref:hypothetical protein n=1 Tax=Streptomyces sp. B93 TaxID=2824875 RepID=UPI001B372645|nr:hypothetical protein [Streptomyces sp. B93]MBQ1093808.1 hypothetical protein [Streptomyces sp. B93]
MSGDGDKNTQERHQEEYQEAQNQNGTLDAVMNMTRLFSPFGSTRGIHFGSTNFEGYDLNDMIDIVESANPELLETAGTALVDARDAIKEAADELAQNLGRIDWEGEAHTAFADWGDSLIKTAQGIADYADVIGTQVIAAGSGLASVRKSMPPRDTRTDRKSVDDIPEAKRVDSNEDYTAALKAEANRQEAINQMYRLASFYTVSAGAMGAAEEPVFPKMPDVGVPAPAPTYAPPERSPIYASLDPMSGSVTPQQTSAAVGAERQHPGTELPGTELAPPRNIDEPTTTPRQPVGTQIDSVGTLQPQETLKPVTVTPPPTTAPATPPGPLPTVVPGATPPAVKAIPGRAKRPGGTNVPRVPPTAQGRPTVPPTATGQTGRPGIGPTGPVGRATPPVQAGGRGTGPMVPTGQPGRPVTPGPTGTRGAAPMQRGIVGGKPLPTGAGPRPVNGAASGPRGVMGTPPVGGSGGGRPSNGVVGGRPVTGATPSGSRAAKLPRGTVVGAEGTREANLTAQRPGQRGVIGAPPASSSTRPPPRRATGGSGGVIGAPTGRAPDTRNGGAAGNQRSGSTRSRRDERRDGAPMTD